MDWNKVDYANVFADIEQENALAAQFTPVAPPSLSANPTPSSNAASSSSSTPAVAAAAVADEWGSFQAPVSAVRQVAAPIATHAPPPLASAPVAQWGSMFAAAGPSAPPPVAPSVADAEFGEFASAAPTVKAPTSMPPSMPVSMPASSSTIPTTASPSAVFAMPSNAPTASALFSSFSGFPSSSPLAALTSQGALRSTAPSGLAVASALVGTMPSHNTSSEDVEFGGFSSAAPSPQPASPLPTPAPSTAPPTRPHTSDLAPVAAPAPVLMSTPNKPPANPPASIDEDFGEFSAPISTSPAPASRHSTGGSTGLGDFTVAPLSPAPLSPRPVAFTPLAPVQPTSTSTATDDEWGGFEAAKPATGASETAAVPVVSAVEAPLPAPTPKAAEVPRAPLMSAEALLGRAMQALNTRSEDDFGTFSSAAPTPTAPAAKQSTGASGFGFLFAGPPLASPLEPTAAGSPIVSVARPQRPASDALADVLVFLIQHERFDEALACKTQMESGASSKDVPAAWRSTTAPAGHLTMADMRKRLSDSLGAALAEKHAAKFGDLAEAGLADLTSAATQYNQALALVKRLIATKGADLTETRRAALQAITTELTAAQEFASLVLLKSSIAGAEEETIRKGIWSSAKANNFFRGACEQKMCRANFFFFFLKKGLNELHIVYRRISHAITEEGSDLLLSGLQASVSVAWNNLFATLGNEAKRIDQQDPALSAKDNGAVCNLCGLPTPQTASSNAKQVYHPSCGNLQRHAQKPATTVL